MSASLLSPDAALFWIGLLGVVIYFYVWMEHRWTRRVHQAHRDLDASRDERSAAAILRHVCGRVCSVAKARVTDRNGWDRSTHVISNAHYHSIYTGVKLFPAQA